MKIAALIFVLLLAALIPLLPQVSVETTGQSYPFMISTFWPWQSGGGTCGFLELMQSNDLSSFFFNIQSQSPYWPSAQIGRDFSITKAQGGFQAGSTLWIAYTTCGNTLGEQTYQWGLSYSNDGGKSFATSVYVDLTAKGLASSVHAWAPEWWMDPKSSGLSAIHVFVSSSNTGACCSGFQIYEMHPTANDFLTNAASWSNVQLITVTGKTDIIDPFLVCKDSGGAPCTASSSGDTFYLFFNDKSTLGGSSCNGYASASTLTGTYTVVGSAICFGLSFLEGPAMIQTTAGSPGLWTLFGDPYNDTYNQGFLEYETSTDNWSTFSAPAFVSAPSQTAGTTGQVKQATVIRYP